MMVCILKTNIVYINDNHIERKERKKRINQKKGNRRREWNSGDHEK